MRSLPTSGAWPTQDASWHEGATLGRYTLLVRLATGGMAELWLARMGGAQGFEKIVVIKRVIEGPNDEEDPRRMFLDEARIASELSHANLVQVFDFGEHDGSYFMAMEYLAGENLSAILKRAAQLSRPMPVDLAVRIASAAAEGLWHAHSRLGPDRAPLNIVHRDVSPQNIVVTYDGMVKVVDFGIATATNRLAQTGLNVLKGKLRYMSPEQARGERVDPRADQFSLAAVLFELVTRTKLYAQDETSAAVVAAGSREALSPVAERSPLMPADLGLVLDRALARSPGERFPSMRAFQVALDDWLHRQPQVPGSAELAAYMSLLFEGRIAERAQLLDAARLGELTPSAARKKLRSETDESASPLSEDKDVSSSRRGAKSVMVGVVLALLLAVGAALFWSFRTVENGSEVAEAVEGTGAQGEAPRTEAGAVPDAATLVLSLETEPPGAAMAIDGQDFGLSPLTIEGLEAGEHRVVARLPDGRQLEETVRLRPGDARTRVVLHLPPLPEPAPPATGAAKGGGEPEVRRGAAVGQRSRSNRGQGKLTLDTTPWTNVSLNGKPLGVTPLVELPLPAGVHVLRLVNEERKISTRVEVEIEVGQTTRKKLRL